MPSALLALAGLVGAVSAANDPISLVTFDGSPRTTFSWTQRNDPVMGGASVGNFTIDERAQIGSMVRTVNDIPFLGLPGFIKAECGGSVGFTFNDASRTTHLQMKIRTQNPEYNGYRVCIGADLFPVIKCLKADFFLTGEVWNTVTIPYEEFTNDWDSATGDPITTCAENPDACVTEDVLRNIAKFSIWAEGVGGDASLDLEWVRAVDLSDLQEQKQI